MTPERQAAEERLVVRACYAVVFVLLVALITGWFSGLVVALLIGAVAADAWVYWARRIR